MFYAKNFLALPVRTKSLLNISSIKQKLAFSDFRNHDRAPILPVLEAVKERIIQLNGFSENFKHKTAIGIISQGYITNASLIHTILELGFPGELLYMASKPHTTGSFEKKYYKSMGIRYFDFADYSYSFPAFAKKPFLAGTYPSGYYDDAMLQYYEKMLDTMRQNLLRDKQYSDVKNLVLLDEGGKFHTVFDRIKQKFYDNNYNIVALGHSTSDAKGVHNETLTYPKILMGGAAIKTIIEPDEIAASNIETLDAVLSPYSTETKLQLYYGVLGCGNIGLKVIAALASRNVRVFYFDLNYFQYDKINQSVINHTKLTQANSKDDLFQQSDIILSCVGADITTNLDYSAYKIREKSPIDTKLVFNFASGEKEFGNWLRQSQDKDNIRIVNPQERDFPDCHLIIANNKKITLKASGMPANMMLRTAYGMPEEKAQIVRAMKLSAIYQLDELLHITQNDSNAQLNKMHYKTSYIMLDAWWQRFILKKYTEYLEKKYPHQKEIYSNWLENLTIETIKEKSSGIVQLLEKSNNINKIKDSVNQNKFYIERKNIISKIDDYLLAPGDRVLSFVLFGYGGIGKTQIAKRYYSDRLHLYTIALFFDAEDRVQLIKQYNEKLKAYTQKNQLIEENEIIKEFTTWIENSPSSLLVYDNVKNHSMLEGLLPKNHGKHRVLITSRIRDGHDKECCEVPPMTKTESYNLVLDILNRRNYKGSDINQIHALTEKLFHFPLALFQASCIITHKQVNSITITQFLENFERNKKDFLLSKTNLTFKNVFHESLFNTWLITKQQLQDTNLPWRQVLQVISLLPPDKIEESIIEDNTTKIIKENDEDDHLIIDRYGIFGCYSLLTCSLIGIGINSFEFVCHSFCVIVWLILVEMQFFNKSLIKSIELKKSLLVSNIFPALEKIIELGIVYKCASSQFSIHRLHQEVLLYDLNPGGSVKINLIFIDTLIDHIQYICDHNLLKNYNINAIADNAQYLSDTFFHQEKYFTIPREMSTPERNKNLSIPLDNEYETYCIIVNFLVSLPTGNGIVRTLNGINARNYYEKIMEKYMLLDFLQIRMFLNSERPEYHETCKICLDRLSLKLHHFYNNMMVSDKIIFFDLIYNVELVIQRVHKYINNISKNNFESTSNFDFNLLKLEYFSQFLYEKSYLPVALKNDLGSYIKEQYAKLALLPLRHQSIEKIQKQINAAKWLMSNVPLASTFNMYSQGPAKISHAEYESYKEALEPGELNVIIQKHYPLILIKRADQMNLASIQWWLKQKDVYKESPFTLKHTLAKNDTLFKKSLSDFEDKKIRGPLV